MKSLTCLMIKDIGLPPTPNVLMNGRWFTQSRIHFPRPKRVGLSLASNESGIISTVLGLRSPELPPFMRVNTSCPL
jgi:hypothetical protein